MSGQGELSIYRSNRSRQGTSTRQLVVFGRITEDFQQAFKDLPTNNFNDSRKTQATVPLISKNLKDTTIGQSELPEGIEQWRLRTKKVSSGLRSENMIRSMKA